MSDYVVERIEGKRIVNGEVQYYLKWLGYPRSENTWEPLENLSCPDFIAEFEESEKKKTKNRKRKLSTQSSVESNGITMAEKKLDGSIGFQRGLIASKILGATDTSGKLMFLMSWKNSNYIDLVPAKVANIKCPQVVIKFYEERLTWQSDIDEKKRTRTSNANSATKRENLVQIDLTEGDC
ncbi:chromobox protein homolog 1 [Drosophila mojavensis]|uniref:Heterochromatin protein 1J n=1 Tax=Drosophila mojavensis TaxID=7230 RepID=B4KNX4_DROMO|nr:chromobox protein homolog 1 [Drosophila mojavensis]EDW09019.1 heterochromatin protein 1J [Drosophila mojavensis]